MELEYWFVIPVKTGIQKGTIRKTWIPACAGKTFKERRISDLRTRGCADTLLASEKLHSLDS